MDCAGAPAETSVHRFGPEDRMQLDPGQGDTP
jgi:hypothetical protein